jgi:hypothetical protein
VRNLIQSSALEARYVEALRAWRNGDWTLARQGFEACLALMPDDGPSEIMLKRLDNLSAMPDGDGWNTAWPLHKET